MSTSMQTCTDRSPTPGASQSTGPKTSPTAQATFGDLRRGQVIGVEDQISETTRLQERGEPDAAVGVLAELTQNRLVQAVPCCCASTSRRRWIRFLILPAWARSSTKWSSQPGRRSLYR